MKNKRKLYKKAFTLVEMLIVIVIIGILAGAIIPKIIGMRQRAEDVAVKVDLQMIASALELYMQDHGSYKIKGGGHSGRGNGWVVLEGGKDYPKSIVHILREGGYLSQDIKASGEKHIGGRKDYMLYLCENSMSYALSARLHRPTDEDIAHIKTTCNGTGRNGTYDKYGMNYAISGGG